MCLVVIISIVYKPHRQFYLTCRTKVAIYILNSSKQIALLEKYKLKQNVVEISLIYFKHKKIIFIINKDVFIKKIEK